MRQRSTASVCQLRQLSSVPRGARTGRGAGAHRSSPATPRSASRQLARAQPLLRLVEVAGEDAVVVEVGDALAQRRDHRGGGRPGTQRGAQLQRLRGGDQLGGEHAAQGGDAAARAHRRGEAHRHVVLLAGARRHAVHRDRRGRGAQLDDHRRGRVLADHQPAVEPGVGGEERGQAARARRVEQAVEAALADRGEVGADAGQHVGGVGERLAVEVAAAHHLAVEHHGVVDDGRELALHALAREAVHVARGAVHLRRAAQRVRVLHGVVRLAVRGHQRAVGEQGAQVGGARRLARRRAAAPRRSRRTRGWCRAAPRRSSPR